MAGYIYYIFGGNDYYRRIIAPVPIYEVHHICKKEQVELLPNPCDIFLSNLVNTDYDIGDNRLIYNHIGLLTDNVITISCAVPDRYYPLSGNNYSGMYAIGKDYVSAGNTWTICSTVNRIGTPSPPIFTHIFLKTEVCKIDIDGNSTRLFFVEQRYENAWTGYHNIISNYVESTSFSISAKDRIRIRVFGGFFTVIPPP